jgi:hypothetical protein
MRRTTLLLLLVTALTASRTDYLSAKRKFDAIENHKYKPGSRVPVLLPELNAYVQTELPKVAPPGVSSPRVELHGNNTATGHALIDFVKLRHSQGKPPNWFLRKLLEGEHEVSVTARVQSAAGKATVYPEAVEISGIPISGGALDFLIRHYLIPNYPKAKIGRPIDLNYGMDRLEVKPDRVDIVMK